MGTYHEPVETRCLTTFLRVYTLIKSYNAVVTAAAIRIVASIAPVLVLFAGCAHAAHGPFLRIIAEGEATGEITISDSGEYRK
jgi:hypothetical protein